MSPLSLLFLSLLAAPPELGITWVPFAGGAFTAGRGERAYPVKVAPFSLARTEVTVAQYAICVQAGACTPAVAPAASAQRCNAMIPGREAHPINCLDWHQARAFARFAGARLPTAAEWAYAAQAGGRDQLFPWGDAPMAEDPGQEKRVALLAETGTEPVCATAARNAGMNPGRARSDRPSRT